jgi:hypothetical protein
VKEKRLMRKLMAVLALALLASVAVAEVREVVLPGHTFLVDSSNRVLYGWGVKPTTPTIPDGTPVPAGTPFWASNENVLYYWSGSAWTSPGLASAPGTASSIFSATPGRLTFEGATVDAFETEFAATDPTADALIYIPNRTGAMVVESAFNYSIPDSGGVGAATYTLQPAGYTLATLACADADGCTVTMGETGILAGASITIIQIAASAGNITIVDDDGTTAELDGDANLVLNTLDSVTLHYAAVGNWIQTAYIDIS